MPEMRNIIIIGTDHTIQAYAGALERDGFAVSAKGAASDSLSAPADVVIVDVSLAGEDPVAKSYLEAAAGGQAPPVIAIISPEQLSSFDPARDIEDFVLAGAPAEEVAARARQAVWKRHRVDTKNVLKCGDLLMDLANYTVHVGGRPVELTYKEYELLRYLATNQGRVVSRETLLSRVWGYDFYGGARTVDVHIRRLRSKIEDRHNVFIETVRNVGYRFRAGV